MMAQTHLPMSSTAGTNTSNGSDNYIQFKFNHAERSASYSYSSDHKLWVTATGTYGLRFRAGNGTGGNLQPYNSTGYYAVSHRPPIGSIFPIGLKKQH